MTYTSLSINNSSALCHWYIFLSFSFVSLCSINWVFNKPHLFASSGYIKYETERHVYGWNWCQVPECNGFSKEGPYITRWRKQDRFAENFFLTEIGRCKISEIYANFVVLCALNIWAVFTFTMDLVLLGSTDIFLARWVTLSFFLVCGIALRLLVWRREILFTRSRQLFFFTDKQTLFNTLNCYVN